MNPWLCLLMRLQSMQQKQTQSLHGKTSYLFSSALSHMDVGLRDVRHGPKCTHEFSSATAGFPPPYISAHGDHHRQTTVNARLVQLESGAL